MSEIKNLSEYIDEAQKATSAQRENSLKAVEDISNMAKEQANSQYNKAIGDAKVAYEDQYQRNAVQKLINERSIAEKNANLGLTDSGLNRTQQTAAQLSYANKRGKIDLERQDAINTLQNNLASAISGINQEYIANSQAVNQSYDQMNTQIGNALRESAISQHQFNTQMDETKRQYDGTMAFQKEQAGINNQLAQDQFNWQKEQAGISNQLAQDQFNWQKEQAVISNQLAQDQFNWQKQEAEQYYSSTDNYSNNADKGSNVNTYTGEENEFIENIKNIVDEKKMNAEGWSLTLGPYTKKAYDELVSEGKTIKKVYNGKTYYKKPLE